MNFNPLQQLSNVIKQAIIAYPLDTIKALKKRLLKINKNYKNDPSFNSKFSTIFFQMKKLQKKSYRIKRDRKLKKNFH